MSAPETIAPVESVDVRPPNTGRGGWYASASLIIFALLLYGDLLFTRSNVVVSHLFGDTCSAFAAWRQFGFRELANENLPLWNPYVFCGAPFVGNLQSAMFYPVNFVLYPWLPLAKAINAEFVFHSLLAGFSMLAWVRSRGAGWLAAVLAAAIVMAGSPVFFRINLGQVNVIAVYAWLPMTLLTVDRLFGRVSAGWLLVGIFVVSMQILAGYPPAVYNNAFAVTIYVGLRMVRHANRLRTFTALIAVAFAPLLICAAPLAAGYHTTRESLRAEGTSFDFATSWSFPPENLLTALAPLFFGDYRHVTYWGRWGLWDASVYIGVGALFLMAYGIVYAPKPARKFSAILLLLLVLTAMGRYTPFYSLLFNYVPGISNFRAPSKFLLPALVFAAMLAGLGANEFLRAPRRTPPFMAAATVCGAVLLAIALSLQFIPSLLDKPYGLWARLVAGMVETGETSPWEPITDIAIYDAASLAGASAFVASAACIATAYLFNRSASKAKYRVALVCFSVAELLCFCRYARVTSELDALSSADLIGLRDSHPGDYRVFQVKSFNANWRRNYPMEIEMLAPWGYDPVMLERYAKFFTYALGGESNHHFLTYESAITNILDPISMSLAAGIFGFTFEPRKDGDDGGAYPFVNIPPLLQLTRSKYVYFWPESGDSVLGGVHGIFQASDPFPRFSIYRDYRVAENKDDILTQMSTTGSDLRQTLFLESEPDPKPDLGAPPFGNDQIEVSDKSTDALTLEIVMSAPGILFVTDAYSNGWNAVSLPGSVQKDYRIMPADYAFRAIPLSAGHHRIQMEYAPGAITLGIWITSISCACFAAASATWAWSTVKLVQKAPFSQIKP